MLIVAFQMLSAVESQWLDFLVFDRAAQRYEDSTELARFVSQFAAIAYGTDIVFLLLLAGLPAPPLRAALRPHGQLARRPHGGRGDHRHDHDAKGAGATIVFVLVVAARVVDLTFSDGTSRTSLSAAYQAVPNQRARRGAGHRRRARRPGGHRGERCRAARWSTPPGTPTASCCRC